MTWFAVYAMFFIIMTDAGIQQKHQQGLLADGKPFATKEACHRWLEKTDFLEYMESEVDKMPMHTVIRLAGGCYQPGKDI